MRPTQGRHRRRFGGRDPALFITGGSDSHRNCTFFCFSFLKKSKQNKKKQSVCLKNEVAARRQPRRNTILGLAGFEAMAPTPSKIRGGADGRRPSPGASTHEKRWSNSCSGGGTQSRGGTHMSERAELHSWGDIQLKGRHRLRGERGGSLGARKVVRLVWLVS